jgi:DNA repair ATPase RecN
MESPKNYRDNLAQKLNDIRLIGDHGKEAAKTILQGEQQTEQYQHAKNLHHEVRDLEKVPNTIDQQINDLEFQIARLKQHKETAISDLVEKQGEYGVTNSVETMKFPIWKTIELSTKTLEQVKKYTVELNGGGSITVEETEPGIFTIVDDSITVKDGDPMADETNICFRSWDDSVQDLDNGDSDISQCFGMSDHLQWEDVELTESEIRAPSLNRLKEALQHVEIISYCPGDI